MLENSKDLLNLLLGFSVTLVAILFSWVLYEIAKTIKGLNNTLKVIENIANGIDEGVQNFKSKAGNASAFLTVFVKSAQSIIKTISEKKGARKNSKNKK
ncbi:hypothetical protein KKH39_02755 [Patescibacteria group bacterium]|nr:hypothetical protein [Patescibacteria group bacterium]